MQELKAASIVLAAGYGTRMRGFSGNKTLLPLLPGSDPFEGEYPIIFEIIGNLPRGPKALVIHHRKDEVIAVTRGLGVSYYDQPVLNGTGGALIAAQDFLEQTDQEYSIIIFLSFFLSVPCLYNFLYIKESNSNTVYVFRSIFLYFALKFFTFSLFLTKCLTHGSISM